MVPKIYLQANDLVRDSFALARKIYDSGFRPDFMLVLWRGGTPVGMVIHEFLLFKGIRTVHAVVKAESYTGIGKRIEPRIEGLELILEQIGSNQAVLVVDDIFDTGCTLLRVCEQLRARTQIVKTAILYYKPACNRTSCEPDFYLWTTDRWIVFPHELAGLTMDEIRQKDDSLPELLAGDG